MNQLVKTVANFSPEKRELLHQRLKSRNNSNVSPLQIRSQGRDTNISPLSYAQQRLWFLDRLEPGNTAFNMISVYRLTGPLNILALKKSLNELVRRHEILRTSFSIVNDEPVQVISLSHDLQLSYIDIRQLSETEREVQALHLVNEETRNPFDLTQSPLFRATLLRLREQAHILILTLHHIVSDGWSMRVLFQELSTLYEAYCQEKASPLAELPIQYADYAAWQREWLQGEVLAKQLTYWKQQLDGVPPTLELPTDWPRPAIQTYRGAQQNLILDDTLSKKLKKLSQQGRATLFMTLLAAFKVLLYRYTGQNDLAVGAPIAGRNRTEIEGLIGIFLNSLVLRTDLSGNPTYQEVLNRVREVTLEAYAHQDIPFEKLLEELQPERSLSQSPLFQVFFNMLMLPNRELEITGLEVERLPDTEVESKFDLTVYVRNEKEGQIHLSWVYNADLFAEARMAEMVRQYEYLLWQIVENPEKRIVEYSLATNFARQYLPDPAIPLNDDWQGAVHQQFSRQARQNPEQIAIVDPQDTWTYQELESRSNQLAHYLLAQGVAKEDIIAVYGHRSASLVWGLLGVLKAGAAFTILDPAYPASRLTDYLEAARPRILLHVETAGSLPNELILYLEKTNCNVQLTLPGRQVAAENNFLHDYPTHNPNIELGPDDLAYIAFTSGSTGKPKAVMGRHGPLSHFLPWQIETFNLSVADRFSMLSGLSHDPLQRDIFTALWVGATLHIPGTEVIGVPGLLARWMAQEKITFTHLTPPMGQILTEAVSPGCQLTSLRYAFFVGDKLTRRDVIRLRNIAPHVTCISSYGSTETQRAVGYHVVTSEQVNNQEQAKAVYPAGHGMPNAQLLILNNEQQLAGVGELGEIYVRSPHLAKGYLNDTPLTEQRFLVNPFTGQAGDRLYRSGDLGRYLPNGQVEFMGRIDQQVKIRGFRVELGEIEAILDQHPAIRENVVAVYENGHGDHHLVAYVLPHQGQVSPTANELRNFLKQKLPEYMVPSIFMTLDTIPLTANNKVDRQRLPEPNREDFNLERTFVAPQDMLELQLTRIWEEFLGVKPIGVRDNFFELGGHSLLGVRLFAQINKILDKNLPVAILFQAPTIEQLANILRQEGWSPPSSSLIPIRVGGSKQPFFCVPPAGNTVLGFANLVQHLGADQPCYGLQPASLNGGRVPYNRVDDIASHFIKEIQTIQPEGPYLLGGRCFGGLVAFEMAQQLQAQGQKIALLALLDTPYPNPTLSSKIKWHLTSMAQLGFKEQLNYITVRINRRIANIISKFYLNTGRPLSPVIQNLATEAGIRKASNTYLPQLYQGKITLFRAEEERLGSGSQDMERGWGKVAANGVEVHIVPGAHNTIMTEPHVKRLAEQLRACLDKAQADSLYVNEASI